MKKSTKGAFAAGTAAVLLMGGAGTLAFWTDEGRAPAGTLTSGNLSLSDIECGDWAYDDAEGSEAVVTKIVPGDILKMTCEATITGEGDHLRATVEVDDDSLQDIEIGTAEAPATVADTLTVTAALSAPAGAAAGVAVDAAGVDVEFEVTVEFPYGTENNGSQDSTVDFDDVNLDGIVVKAVQVHD